MKTPPFGTVTVILGLVVAVLIGARYRSVFGAAQVSPPSQVKAIEFIPTPPPMQVFWVDTAGNIGMRGVTAVIPGKVDPRIAPTLSASCRASAERNGVDTLTICTTPDIGRLLAAKLNN